MLFNTFIVEQNLTSMKKFALCLMIFFPLIVNAQERSEEQAIREVIAQLFNGMRAGDSSMVSDVFIEQAKMQSISVDPTGEVRLVDTSLSNFLKAVGTPHDEIWDERILDYEIQVDGAMASVWTPYQFYRGQNFSHCGVNSFQLAKMRSGWKIIYLVDTRRREGCQ